MGCAGHAAPEDKHDGDRMSDEFTVPPENEEFVVQYEDDEFVVATEDDVFHVPARV